jgi:uncharacterized protein YdaU (DUF1376 family)
MHYYKLNISDWNLATAHLSLEEEAIYFRLINYYYDTEQPIPLETQMVMRRLRLGCQMETVELILNEFFEKHEDGWRKERCESELAEYHKKAGNNRENGKLGGRPKKINKLDNNPEKTQMVSENNPDITLTINHKPLTINQEPLTKINNKTDVLLLSDFGIDGDLSEDFIRHRKSKKASITRTVMAGFQREADKAGISIIDAVRISIERNWQGFNAEWYQSKATTVNQKPDKLDATILAAQAFLGGSNERI